jgi:hypothetical protein
MNILPGGLVRHVQRTLRYLAQYPLPVALFPSQRSHFAAVFARISGAYSPLCSPRYVIRRIILEYLPPKTPATLSGANRYAIWRESFEGNISVTWPGK